MMEGEVFLFDCISSLSVSDPFPSSSSTISSHALLYDFAPTFSPIDSYRYYYACVRCITQLEICLKSPFIPTLLGILVDRVVSIMGLLMFLATV
jgi:hypothetical protein